MSLILTGAHPAALRRGACIFLTVGVALLASCPSAAAISGYATPGPAVVAQYPDAAPRVPRPGGPLPGLPVAHARGGAVLVDLDQVIHLGRAQRRDPTLATQIRMTRDAVARRVPPAAVAAIHFGVRDSVSVALLAAGAGVLLLGAALRWRRSAASGLNG